MDTQLTTSEVQELHRLRALFPQQIGVALQRSEDGGFTAEVKDFPGVVTEGDTLSELIEMVNDALFTYFDVPEKLQPFVGTYIPPIDVAQAIGIYPVEEKESEVTMQLV